MRREELQAVQAPLKQRYREDPDTGVVTLRAEGELDSTAVSCSVQTGRALVACAGVTLRSVAVNRDIPLAGGRITAEGELDFRGTMGVDREAPVGFRAIRLRFELEPPLNAEAFETLLELTERYCVVYQTIAQGVPVTISHTSH
jgi:uncharacterized OsmC-like protein